MYYTTVGEGRDILFLHGWGCDGSVFLPVANRLSGYRSILPDLNGFGKTPPPPCAWDVRNYAEETAEMLRGMGVNKTLVVAHSFGARVALAGCPVPRRGYAACRARRIEAVQLSARMQGCGVQGQKVAEKTRFQGDFAQGQRRLRRLFAADASHLFERSQRKRAPAAEKSVLSRGDNKRQAGLRNDGAARQGAETQAKKLHSHPDGRGTFCLFCLSAVRRICRKMFCGGDKMIYALWCAAALCCLSAEYLRILQHSGYKPQRGYFRCFFTWHFAVTAAVAAYGLFCRLMILYL